MEELTFSAICVSLLTGVVEEGESVFPNKSSFSLLNKPLDDLGAEDALSLSSFGVLDGLFFLNGKYVSEGIFC